MAVSAGRYHTCALLPGGHVECWGDNRHGQARDYVVADGPAV